MEVDPIHRQAEATRAARLEIAHVLFTDIVGYSRLPMDEQTKLLRELQEVIRATAEFREAQERDQLITLPTGDGLALVFFGSPEDPVQCAIEISRALRGAPGLGLRMGVHSGPVYRVADINTQLNVAGGGINTAQRVMDCGDAGHLLVSGAVADVLCQLSGWAEKLHDLGEAEVKHGERVRLFNLYTDEIGNPDVPRKVRADEAVGVAAGTMATTEGLQARPSSSAGYVVAGVKRHERGAAVIAAAVLALAGALSGWAYLHSARGDKAAITSMAVLPFQNAGGDTEAEYLCDGISESLINSLSQLPQLKIIARSSAFKYKGREVDPRAVGRELDVEAVLTGRITRRGDSLLISAELMDARDNSHIWGEQYNRKLSDVFTIQGEIAKDISERLRLKLTGEDRQQLARRYTENFRAYQHYAQGRSYADRRTREDLLTAIDHYEKAIEEDKNYAQAYAGLAEGYANLGIRGYIDPVKTRRKAEEAAHKALALDENLAEAHVAIGRLYMEFVPYDFSVANRELRRAIELSPSLASAHQYLGISLTREGRLDESMEPILKARHLDPLSPIIARQAALTHFLKRDYVRALEVLRQAEDLGPLFTTTWEIGVYVQNRLYDEALEKLANEKLGRKDDPLLIFNTGMIYAAQGRRADALQMIKELEGMSGTSLSHAHRIAKIYAALNEKELAFQWLERGLERGVIAAFYKDEPVWDTIRSDQRFPDLLRRMGVPT